MVRPGATTDEAGSIIFKHVECTTYTLQPLLRDIATPPLYPRAKGGLWSTFDYVSYFDQCMIVYDLLLWETTDRDVTVERLVV